MSFELDDAGAREIDDQARRNGVPLGALPDPTPFQGTAGAIGKGFARGLIAKPAAVAGDAATPLLRAFVARPLDSTFGTQFESWLQDQRTKNYDVLEQWKPDPLTTGFAGQLVNGLVDVGSSAIVFGPGATAAASGYAKRQEDIGKGVDPMTATATGALEAAGTYAGLRIPLTIGRAGGGATGLARNVAFGAAVSVETGTAEQSAAKALLAGRGYQQQADAIHPFDSTTLTAEALMGGLFSAGGHAMHARATTRGQNATDAALTMGQARHAAIDTAPGVPTDARSQAAHARALDAAGRALMRNEQVDVGDNLAGATFLRRDTAGRSDVIDEALAHVADIAPQDIGPIKTERDVRRAVQESPEEAARAARFEASPENLAELRKAIAGTKNPENRKLLETELARQEAAATKLTSEPVVERAARLEPPRPEPLRGEPPRGEPVDTRSSRPTLEVAEGARPERITDGVPLPDSRIEPSFETAPVRQDAAVGATPFDIFPTEGRVARETLRSATLDEQPTVRAAVEAATTRPDMMVALEDGVQLPAREVVQRAYEQRQVAKRESQAYEAAVNCFLRTA